jgi:hypothetical protein
MSCSRSYMHPISHTYCTYTASSHATIIDHMQLTYLTIALTA